jgi:methylenetetrahydrofolate reductase (NADPH)
VQDVGVAGRRVFGTCDEHQDEAWRNPPTKRMRQPISAHIENTATLDRLIDRNLSIEISSDEARHFAPDQNVLPHGSRVFLPHIKGKSLRGEVEAATALKQSGYVPVPHLAARNYDTVKEYVDHVEAHARNGIENVLFLGGNPSGASTALSNAEQLLKHPVLAGAAIKTAFIAAYPEGHPEISSVELRRALERKLVLCREKKLSPHIVSQFAFDGRVIGRWAKAFHSEFTDLPVFIGIAGVTSLPKLVKFGVKCGIGPSLAVLRRSAGNLLHVLADKDPADVIAGIEESYPVPKGPLTLHFFPFGGWKKTLDWVKVARE